jgi:hypothetical protein
VSSNRFHPSYEARSTRLGVISLVYCGVGPDKVLDDGRESGFEAAKFEAELKY